MSRKQNLAVLFGGRSPEHQVSLHSAHAVLTAVDRKRYNVLPIGITPDGDWFHYFGEPVNIPDGAWQRDIAHLRPVVVSQNRSEPGLLEFPFAGYGSAPVPIPLAAAFPVLHGRNGEDGTVQSLLELSGIPVVGCGTLASALCMDKERAHALAGAAGIPVPRSVSVTRDGLDTAEAAVDSLSYPLFVKPLRAGSSFGITRIGGPEELRAALRRAFAYDDTVLAEEAVEGFEVGCAVLGSRELTVGRVDEIELARGFFDYTEKYTLKTSRIHVPARIAPADEARVQETAKKLYRLLGCTGFARVDMFFTPDREIVFNEINTIPGLTEHSRFPAMLRAVGLPLSQVVERAIALAVEP